MSCNCESTTQHTTQRAEVTRMALQPDWHFFNTNYAIPPSYAPPTAVQYVPYTVPVIPAAPMVPQYSPAVLVHAMNGMQLSGPATAPIQHASSRYLATYPPYLAQHVPLPQPPPPKLMYAFSASGVPINVGNGAVVTETRGIFVSNLPFKARLREIETYFGKAGTITKCDLPTDAATGRPKGTATITYASASDARAAVRRFNNTTFMSMPLHVRADKETTPLRPPPMQQQQRPPVRRNVEPIIVNGSQVG